MVVEMCQILHVKTIRLDSKYLGLPLFVGRSKKKAFEEVKAKVLSEVAGWKMHALFLAGRTTLIRAVATSMPLYSVSIFLLPKGWCEDIDRVLKDFWWGFDAHKRQNFTPKAWDSICLPKERGGIGFRKMYEVNLALVAKLGWQYFHCPDRLWVRLAKAKYNHLSPLEPLMQGRIGSSIWKGILQAGPLLKLGLYRWPQNGCTTRLCEDPWLPSGENFQP